jgi:preprotein translocase subunit Sss1
VLGQYYQQIIPEEDQPTKNKTLRRVVFMGLEIISTLVISLLIYQFVGSSNYWLLLGAILLLIFLTFLISLSSILFSTISNLISNLIYFAIIFIPTFFSIKKYEILIIAFLTIILAVVMNFKVKGALTNQIKFNFGAISNSAKGIVVVIISLALACMIWSQRIVNKSLINENEISYLLNAASPIVSNFLPGFNSSATINDLINGVVKTQLESQEISSQIEALSGFRIADLGQTLSKEIYTSSLKNFENIFQMNLTGNEKISNLIYQKINQWFEKQQGTWFNLIALLVIWGICWFVIGILGFIIDILFSIFFKLLKILKIITFSKITVEKEILSF